MNSRVKEPRFRVPRLWSNVELRKVSPLLGGRIINISAGKDNDKEGDFYRNYFINAAEYSISNYSGAKYRGYQGLRGEIELDLEDDLPEELKRAYDVVFNHTTLEHVLDIRKAFTNLCQISNDLVILVVPFCQVQHETPGYQDFWRFTPTCLRALFKEEGYSVVLESCNNDFNTSVYVFMVASRSPAKWKGVIPDQRIAEPCGQWVGAPPSLLLIVKLLFAYILRKLRRI